MTPAPPLRLRTQSIMQTVCKLPLTVAISHSQVPFLSMGCVVGLGVPQCLHVPVLEHAWGDHRGAQVAPKPCSSHTNPQQSLPHGSGAVLPHQHRGCVQRGASLTPATGEPTAAAGWGTSPRVATVTGGGGLGPKAGGGQRVPAPCTILSGVGRWPWPNPSLLTRAEAARARGCWAGRPGCCRHARPWSCTADQARPAPRCSHTEPNPTSSGALSV